MRPGGEASRSSRRASALWSAGVVLAVLLAGFARARTALGHPSFAGQPRAALLKSDPALLLYITERIVDAGGRVPADFRHDPRVQSPEGTDLAAEFTVGQEFLVAWVARLAGPGVPLHVVALWVSSFLSAAAGLALYLLVLARTGARPWAALAAVLFLVLPANSRTLGFVLMREDLALPLFVGHLAALGWAVRRRGPGAFLLAGLLAGAALATWYAMGFVLALEVGLLALWFLWGPRSPFELPGAWAVLVGPVLAATLVPALRASDALLSLPLLGAAALLGVALLRGRGHLRARSAGALAGVALFAVLVLLADLLVPGRSAGRHVFELLLAKAQHAGGRPSDPSSVPFDARLLWQGPFQGLDGATLYAWVGTLGWLAAGLFLLLGYRARRSWTGFEALVAGLFLLSLPLAWQLGRLIVLVGLSLPALACVARERRSRPVLALVPLVLLAAVGYARDLRAWQFPWYRSPADRHEQVELVRFVEEELGRDEVLSADFVNATMLLCCTGNPITLQPKYDTERSRRRIQVFLDAWGGDSAEELARVLRERFRSRILIVDEVLRVDLEWTAGLTPRREPQAVAHRPALLEAAGFESLYASPRYRVWRVPAGT